MTNPNTIKSTGKDKSTPIGLVSNSLDEDSDTAETPDDQSADATSPDASDESEN
jgi:hypothetical protein